MKTLQERIIIISALVSLICTIQVTSLPVRENWRGLIQRTKRSLLWRWNNMKPVGTSCMYHLECGTKFCRRNICSFWNST